MKSGEDEIQVAELTAIFKALGDKTRLRIFEFLRACHGSVSVDENGDVRRTDGPTVGEVCCHLTGDDKISSVVSFHLKELRQAGLIEMDRRGRHIVCAINPRVLERMTEYLTTAPTGEACGCPPEMTAV
ncbi:MAG: helix-turn-helix transcriptional regulator [Fibrella sp.]|nr:helix-turn-helix transcriptional regulator [Armatimonadota bacterium]